MSSSGRFRGCAAASANGNELTFPGPRSLTCGDRTRVVIYDARESMWAARLWWMLRAFGFEQAAVLNGGWTAWQLERRPISSRSSHRPTTFTPVPQPGRFVGKDEVLQAVGDPKAFIVCALGRRQYSGERREYGRRRGHIPGARNVSAWRILDRATQRYRPHYELRKLSGPILDAERIITSASAASQPPATRSSFISSATPTSPSTTAGYRMVR